jgi:hypothetical protein
MDLSATGSGTKGKKGAAVRKATGSGTKVKKGAAIRKATGSGTKGKKGAAARKAAGSGTKGEKGAAVGKAGGPRKESVTRLADAGLDTHVRLVTRDLQKVRDAQRAGNGPPDYIVDRLENITSDVLQLAKNAALRQREDGVEGVQEPKSPRKSAKSPKKKAFRDGR